MSRKHSFTAVALLPSKVYCCQTLLLSYKTKKRGSLGNGLLFWHRRERQSRLRAVSYFSCVCSRFKSTRERRAAKPRRTRAPLLWPWGKKDDRSLSSVKMARLQNSHCFFFFKIAGRNALSLNKKQTTKRWEEYFVLNLIQLACHATGDLVCDQIIIFKCKWQPPVSCRLHSEAVYSVSVRKEDSFLPYLELQLQLQLEIWPEKNKSTKQPLTGTSKTQWMYVTNLRRPCRSKLEMQFWGLL